MTRRAENAAWCLAFVVLGLLGVALGRWTAERDARLDLWCTGESAHEAFSGVRPAWLTTRFRLDLSPGGISHMRMIAQLVDAETGAEIGTIHRNSAFEVAQQKQRLQLNVMRGAKGEADSPIADLSGRLSMFIFRPDSSLSYWVRSLSQTRYLFDDGNDMFILCSKR
ncbi:hypothetical protein [Pseudomonas sp. Irchel s3b5]|uniref:hypothetical protein n=1 Tax=Pseudomonas sp. Irchel s3b5 TaxID=2009077 RepID=UPI000BA387B6|nr:hypothetical protein [Pseudomonas sp. Irchel s3b5]